MLSLARRRALSIFYRSSFPSRPSQRFLSTSAVSRSGEHANSRPRRLGTLAFTGALCSSAYVFWKGSDNERPTEQHRGQLTPLGELLRTYAVYSMCSIPFLVDYSPKILSSLLAVPGVGYVTEKFVRATFFSQFVGGDTALDTVPLLDKLRAENKGALFAYSVEVDEDEAAGKVKAHAHNQPVHKRIVAEMIRCIDVAADFEDQRKCQSAPAFIATGRRTWVAVKLTALLPDALALIKFSKHLVDTRPPPARPVCFPGSPRPSDFAVLDADPLTLPETCPLTKEDIDALKELKSDLFRVCQRAKERGVKIIIDAEHSWYQPAIDAFQFALMAEFNRLPTKPSSSLSRAIFWKASSVSEDEGILVQPLVYGTFQAYLRRTPEHLAQSILDAKAGNFALGVKLVRGAYHPFEVSAHATRRFVNQEGKMAISAASGLSSLSISPESLPPVWETKANTDASYNACSRMLIGQVASELAGSNASRVGKSDSQSTIPKLGILFGTHNWESCDFILEALVREGLASRMHEGDVEVIHIADDVAERVTLGQLYGMRDSLTNHLVEKTRSTEPFVIKYVPYGMLAEVMPYLGRRAIENKSVLGNGAAREERKEAGAEIKKRFFSLFQ